MRLKLVFLLLCLVAIALADTPKKVEKTPSKARRTQDGENKGVIDDKNSDESDGDSTGEEDEDERAELRDKSRKNGRKGTTGRKAAPSKNDRRIPTKTKKNNEIQFVSDNESVPNITPASFSATAREYRMDKLREIINETSSDDIESLRQIEDRMNEGEGDPDDENKYQACNSETAGDEELCHCDMDEINCSAIVMDSDEPHLRSMDLSIAKKDFKPIKANFSTNGITKLVRDKILPGYEKYISVLDISYNQVRFVDNDVFKPFTNLTKLDLSHNNFQPDKNTVFDYVGETLHRLDLGYNRIKKLANNIFSGLSNLKVLILDGNPIKEWKKEIFKGLDNLEELSLDNCNINDLPSDIFEYLPKLVGLSIRGNPLEEIPSVVANMKTLKDIDMSGTNLTEIRNHAFAGDSDLEEIILENMPFLSAVRDCGFCGLPKLKTLLLNDNSALVEIHPNAFGFIKSDAGHKAAALTEFAIHNSNVSTISEHMINYDKLDSFKIGGNPWNCNCDTQFLLEEKFTFKQDSIAPRCRYPEELKDRHLATVHVTDACEDARFLGRSGRFSSVLALALLVAFIALGLFYLQSSGKLAKLIQQVKKEPEVSYTNLQSNGEDFAMESNFQPRPAEV